MLMLVFEKEGFPLFRRGLDQQRIVIGRDALADIQLVSPEISRQHCVLEAHEETFRLKDLSRNGTRLNKKPVRETLIKPGDEIAIGSWTLKIAAENPKTEETFIEKNPNSKIAFSPGGMIGNSRPMQNLLRLLEKGARSDATICLVGESGTGKELAAKLIHRSCGRGGKPFVAVNCGAIPENLIESLLFGHEKGAFTGAQEKTAGVFEEAQGGTLFLDEIGEMPLELQSRLLRVLEEKTMRRIGGRSDIPVDFRLITATNKNLEAEVTLGRFRRDLFYRLYVFPVFLPPLRERTGDIEELAKHFLNLFSPSGKVKILVPEAVTKLKKHSWGGNVRELKNAVQRALLLSRGKRLKAKDFELAPIASPPAQEHLNLDIQEKSALVGAMRKAKGNYSAAARFLGIARTTVTCKIKRLRIDPSEWK